MRSSNMAKATSRQFIGDGEKSKHAEEWYDRTKTWRKIDITKSGIRGRSRRNGGGGKRTLRSNKHCPALVYGASHHRPVYERMVARSSRPRDQLRCGNPDDAPDDGRADMDRWVGAPRLAAQFCLPAAISGEHAETATTDREGQ